MLWARDGPSAQEKAVSTKVESLNTRKSNDIWVCGCLIRVLRGENIDENSSLHGLGPEILDKNNSLHGLGHELLDKNKSLHGLGRERLDKTSSLHGSDH